MSININIGDALKKKKEGGKKSMSLGPDKQSMLALGDAIKARLEMEKDFDTIDPEAPPPEAVALEGQRLPGMAAGWIGLYERQAKREKDDKREMDRAVKAGRHGD